ncbi:MAG: SDR family NAD(P)-dependent oxidoreductase [Limisphaerales bacterium]
MNSELAGKTVVITGASGGIGSAMAKRFAGEGARLVLHYRRNQPGIAALRRELGGAGFAVVRADLAREAGAERLLREAVKRFGRVDTLVANAGSWETRDVPMSQMSLRQWRQTFEGVLTTAFLSLREFLRVAARQRRGNAVVIASTAALFGEAGHADYAAAKAALAWGLTRSLKNELARHITGQVLVVAGGMEGRWLWQPEEIDPTAA